MKSKLLLIFLFLLIISSYFVSAGATQTGQATLTVVGCNSNTCSEENSNYSSNITGDVIADAESHVSLLSIIINFFKGIFG
ncbi:MAG TPA: hypothetical protein VJ438_04220 [Candidatus Nanoarchaeia archaeon]|nr:hypothetical protein [Candidatus Nanoarchaeia archaeon]